MTKSEIFLTLQKMKSENLRLISSLTDKVCITDYSHLVRDGIWTQALQAALCEHEYVIIPKSAEPYYIDAPVIIPSNRHIEADIDAVIKLTEGNELPMLRNENTANGTHMPIPAGNESFNISINGGIWEEPRTTRAGYGKSGKYDAERSFYGVSCCMLFNNIINFTLTNATFRHTAGFAVQIGNIKNAVFENIKFEECYADGIHCNGNTENLLVQGLDGEVGDDLIALNMYDWQDSSVNFGPLKTAWCENVSLKSSTLYSSQRILPGKYYYDDGSCVDCSVTDVVIKGFSGVNVFKMYYQTPSFKITSKPERGDVGSGKNIYFEDIELDLFRPGDGTQNYMDSDPITGYFGAFEICSDIDGLYFENIRVKLYPEKFPLSRFMTVGPKCARVGDIEIFDPYVSCTADNIHLKNVTVNGKPAADACELFHEVAFDDIYGDGIAVGKGTVKRITVDVMN